MKNWIKNIFQGKKEKEILKWETDDSILEFLRQNLDEAGALAKSAEELPDEKRVENEVKFAPGLADAMFGANDSKESTNNVKKLVRLLSEVAKSGDEQCKSDFYREITENESVIGIIDKFLERVIRLSLPINPYLYDYAYSLAAKTNNRNSVKFGIAILGLCQNKEPIADIKLLGLHDEFTVYSTVALISLSGNSPQDLWYLAKRVDGWGKIQIVERLAEMDLPGEIRDWLLYKGYKNSIMYEYLAFTCAINGHLNNKLLQDTIDEELFQSVGDIIVALLNEGPVQGISGYPDSCETIGSYLRHAKKQDLSLMDFIKLNSIKEFLEEPENEVTKNWSQDDLSNCLIDLAESLTSKDWTSDVEMALKSADNFEYWNGKEAAQKLGIDISDTVWRRLFIDPLDSTSWYDVIQYTKPENAKEIVAHAIDLLPLKEMATGPKDALGFGPDFPRYQSLDYVITFLADYPKLGQELIIAGLQSPVTRNRNMTLNTLESWTRENWSTEITNELVKLKDIEPNADTKKNIKKLLKGEKIGS